MNIDRLKRNEHPGWSVQLEDGSWLCAVHGLYAVEDAFYATVMDTEAEAKRLLKNYINNNQDIANGKITPAWEPMCQMLIHDVERLKSANKISPSTIFDIQMSLEDVISTIKGVVKDLGNDDE